MSSKIPNQLAKFKNFRSSLVKTAKISNITSRRPEYPSYEREEPIAQPKYPPFRNSAFQPQFFQQKKPKSSSSKEDQEDKLIASIPQCEGTSPLHRKMEEEAFKEQRMPRNVSYAVLIPMVLVYVLLGDLVLEILPNRH